MRLSAPEQCLRLLRIADTRNLQSSRSISQRVLPRLQLIRQQGRVRVQREAQRVELLLRLRRRVIQTRVLIQVPNALLVLIQPQAQILGLVGLVPESLQVGGDFDDFLRSGSGSLVFGEVFVGVAGRVGGFRRGGVGFVAGELSAVGYCYVFGWLVAALGGEVLDLADDGFAVQDLAEDDVFVVQVGGCDGGDEELRAIGSYKSSQSSHTRILRFWF